jgi:methylase of polypeptide subunit release factors
MGYELPIDTLYHKDEEMTKLDEFNAQFDRLLKNEPVEYIINEAQFLEYKLYVDPNVLIPRMETQELIAGSGRLPVCAGHVHAGQENRNTVSLRSC